MNYKVIINSIIATAATSIATLLGGWGMALEILVILMIIDYLTGIAKAFLEKKLASAIGWRGLFKKISIIVIIVVCHQADMLISNSTPIFKTMGCFYYAANEGLSILENVGTIGLPLPGFLKNALQLLKDSNDNIDSLEKKA
jgi:toxin secretion/phage lysis holin